jgi:two-component system response regulator (stage 0 sporulation protein A)
MFTIEQKVDLIMRYIASTDKDQSEELRKAVVEALKTEGDIGAAPDVEFIIDDILREIGMPASLKGYDYIVCAIKLILSDRVYLDEITKWLYPDVAKAFGVTAPRVERAIRHAVTVAFERSDADTIERVFGNTVSMHSGKVTNSEFLATMYKYVSRKMREAQQ